jgi:nucleotide-binding universal stress UspA family protein
VKEGNMTSTAPRHAVVVAVDGSPASDRAVSYAADEAVRMQRPLHVLHAYTMPAEYTGRGMYTVYSETDYQLLRDAAWTILSDAVQAAEHRVAERRGTGVEITSELVDGRPAAAVVDASQRAHVVVLGARGRGALAGALLGSVSTQVSTHAACPVVVVKDREHPERPRDGVVVGVDGVTDSQPALAYAFEQAASRGTSLEAVHAWLWRRVPPVGPLTDHVLATHRAEESGRLVLAESLAGWSEKYPDVDVLRSVVHGEIVPELLARCDGASVLVVGSRGRGGFAGLLLGSTSHQLLQQAGCPVAVVRGPS